VTHQAGAARRIDVDGRYRSHGVAADVVEFIDDMARRYAEADLIICRAGASTIAELAAAGIASVLVPVPARGGRPPDGQRALSRRTRRALAGAAGEFTAQRLCGDSGRLHARSVLEMARSARAAGKPRRRGRWRSVHAAWRMT
jgi:UDP-N-acetylglucosamine--N-acetylmuramyl-(pentapeptide) pyrophosphoryl-undecaprenol N-acetylglucosamine transferase